MTRVDHATLGMPGCAAAARRACLCSAAILVASCGASDAVGVGRMEELAFVDLGIFQNSIVLVDEQGAVFSIGDRSWGPRSARLERATLFPAVARIDTSLAETCGTDIRRELYCVHEREPPRLVFSDVRDFDLGGLVIGCALGGDGVLSCWGQDRWAYTEHEDLRSGDLLGPDHVAAWRSTPVAIAREVDSFAFSGQHVCIVRDGAVLCRGANVYGQTTDSPPLTDGFHPVDAPPAMQISLDWSTSCLLAADGIWCWGQLGPGDCPVYGGRILRADVAACAHPQPRRLVAMPAHDPYARIFVAPGELYAITASGRLDSMSLRDDGPTPTPLANDVVRVAASRNIRCYLRAVGDVLCQERTPGYFDALGLATTTSGTIHLRHPSSVVPNQNVAER